MSQQETECFGSGKRERHETSDWTGLAEFGFFLILIGAIFLATPNILNSIANFFSNFKLQETFTGVFLPTPDPAGDYAEIYRALMYFCFAYGVFEVVILVLRFALKSSVYKKAGTIGGIVFWLGVGILANILLAGGNTMWFLFISGLIISIGLSIMVRAIVTMFSR